MPVGIDVDLFVNERSVHGQFPEPASFRVAFARLMAMRAVAGRFDREVYCSRGLLSAQAVAGMTMPQTIQYFPEAQRRSALSWMTRSGPFWDDIRHHGADDWLESRYEIVTESAVGEAGYRSIHGFASGLISVTPSDWDFSPVTVTWRQTNAEQEDRQTELQNWRTGTALEESMRNAPVPLGSWEDLRRASILRYTGLTFAPVCFDPLMGMPFAKSAAERILVLLNILDQRSRAFDSSGRRTSEGQRLYQDYFTGDKALFSDSSDTEKRSFHSQLTFPHPTDIGKTLLCTWHGKVRHMNLRLHYSWSERVGEPVYIVYVGPKITRR